MMELDVKHRSKGIFETLRERIVELEDLEAMGAATPDTCEMLVDLHELLDRTRRHVAGTDPQNGALGTGSARWLAPAIVAQQKRRLSALRFANETMRHLPAETRNKSPVKL